MEFFFLLHYSFWRAISPHAAKIKQEKDWCEAAAVNLTGPESLPHYIFWQGWNQIPKWYLPEWVKGKRARVSLRSPAEVQRSPGRRHAWCMLPRSEDTEKLVSGNMWQMGHGKETLVRPFSAACLHKRGNYAICRRSLHRRTVAFYFILLFMVFGRELGFNKWTKFAHFEVGASVQNSEELWGQVDWFNGASQQLIYPKCLWLCDVCHELTSSGFVRFFYLSWKKENNYTIYFLHQSRWQVGTLISFIVRWEKTQSQRCYLCTRRQWRRCGYKLAR